jgi:hypothetical protein
MSKPNIFAYCKAGCPWETVHRDEFEKSAAYIKQYPYGDGYTLEAGKTYRINTIHNSNEFVGFWAFSLTIMARWNTGGVWETVEKIVTLPEFDTYAQSVTIRFHEIYNTIMNVPQTHISCQYDLNDERKLEILTDIATDYSTATDLSATIKVKKLWNDNIIEVLLVNEDAEVRAKDAYEIACEEGFEGTRQEWLASLKGADGKNGTNGKDGKSAYAYAQDGGYAGTEEEFAKAMANMLALPIYEGNGIADLITFKINTSTTIEYFATSGMTWSEWVASEYNTDGYIVGADGIVYTANNEEVMTGGTVVKASNVIVADATYDYNGG